jgi:hypothetical protein
MADRTACAVAVRMATGEAFTDEEIQRDLFDPLDEKIRRMQATDALLAPGEAVRAAADELARQKVAAALREATQKFHAERAAAWQDREVDAMTAAGMRSDKVARSLMQGTSGELYGSENSIDSYGLTRGEMLKMPLRRAIAQMPGLMDRLSSLVRLVGDPKFQADVKDQVARINGNGSIDVTNDEAVNHAAQAIAAALESARVGMNGVGAMIHKLEGYTGRLNHDSVKAAGGMWRELQALVQQQRESPAAKTSWQDLVKRAEVNAARTWIAFTKPLLHPKTFEGVDWSQLTESRAPKKGGIVSLDFTNEDDLALTAQAKQDAADLHARGVMSDPTDLRELFLYRVWQRITSGQSVAFGGALDHLDFTPRVGNLADAVGKGKTLQFLTPRAETTYAGRYVSGSYYANVLRQLDRAGRNIALLERLGPNPEAGYDHIMERLASTARARGESESVVKLLGSSATRAPYEIVSGVGNIPVSLRLAAIGQNLRGWMSVTKLGSIGLSKVSDVPYTAQMLMRYGASFGDAYRLAAANAGNMADADMRRMGEALGAGMNNWTGRLVAGTVAGDGRPGTMARWTTQSYRASLYTAMTEGVEHMAVGGMSQLYGGLADHGWGELPADVRATFQRFGIGEEHWDTVRQGLAPMEEDGRTYLTLDHLDAGAADPHVQETAGLFHMLFRNGIADAINEPRAREASAARAPGSTLGLSGPVLRPGTPQGEVWSSFAQFKGFLTSALTRHLLPAVANAPTRPMMLVNIIFGTMIAGYVSLQAKALSRGELPKTPQDLMEGAKGMNAAQAWGAIMGSSLAQGGGLGLYGDFLFGELDRNGEPFDLSSTQGPLLSQAEQVGKVLGRLAKGDPGAAGGAIKLAAQNIPIVNTWYTRAALDYLLTWRLQEAVNPGYLQRYQSRMQEKAATRYWLPPSSAAQ